MPSSGPRAPRLAIAALAALVSAACTPSPQTGAATSGRPSLPAFVSFHGYADPATGTLEIHPDPAPAPGALTIVEPVADGQTGTGPDDTIELQTLAVSNGFVTDGCAPGVLGFTGSVRLRSFLRNQPLTDVYVEITNTTPSGYGGSGCDGSVTPAPPGLDNAYGLWSYGTIAPKGSAGDSADATWRFRSNGGQPFTFTGRIWATFSAPVLPPGAPAFDWTPTVQNAAPRAFVETGDTIAHIVWDGTSYADLKNPGLTFTKVGSPTSAFSLFPGAPYATGFNGDPYGSPAYFWADPSGTGLNAQLAGDFTACVKFKPGPHPYDEGGTWPGFTGTKVLFGFGQAEPWNHPVEGWSLMQMHRSYCFHYHTAAEYPAAVARGKDNLYQGLPDPQGPIGDDTMVYVLQNLATNTPADVKSYAYDYLCGGRNGGVLRANSHGGGVDGIFTSYGTWPAGSFASAGAGLLFSIGAYPGQTVSDTTWSGTCEGTPPTPVACTLANQDPVCAAYNNGGLTTGHCNYGFCSADGTTPCHAGNAATVCLGAGNTCTPTPAAPTYTAIAGGNPAHGAGVYEVIISSAPATIASMNAIVSLAEGRKLPGSPATYVGSGPDPTSVSGPDGASYVLPPYATVPVANDGSGLLEADRTVEYLGPLTSTATTSGYCVGVNVQPTAGWSSVAGGILGYDDGAGGWGASTMYLTPTSFRQLSDTALTWTALSGTASHVLKVCVTPGGSTSLYLDAATTPTASATAGASALDLGAATTTRTLHIGEGGGAALTGARIRRVFICPSSDPASCN